MHATASLNSADCPRSVSWPIALAQIMLQHGRLAPLQAHSQSCTVGRSRWQARRSGSRSCWIRWPCRAAETRALVTRWHAAFLGARCAHRPISTCAKKARLAVLAPRETACWLCTYVDYAERRSQSSHATRSLHAVVTLWPLELFGVAGVALCWHCRQSMASVGCCAGEAHKCGHRPHHQPWSALPG